MHDNQVEGRLRAVLGAEGDALPLTITPEELERRLVLRRREHFGRRFSLIAAGVAVIAFGSALALSTGWLRTPDVGSGPSPAPSFDSGVSAPPDMSIPSAATIPCETIDPATLDEPPRLLMGTTLGDASAIDGQRSSYRLADRQVGDEGTWDHDTIGIQPVLAGFPTKRLQVLARNPDACLVGLRVDALPSENPNLASTRIAELSSDPTSVIEFDKPPVGDWFVRVHADFATVSGAKAWAEAFFSVEVADCTPMDTTAISSPPAIEAGVEWSDASRYSGIQVASEWDGRSVGTSGSWDGLQTSLDPLSPVPPFQAIELSSDACMIDPRAEAMRIDDAGAAEPGATPLELPITRGAGTKVIAIDAPPVGDWALRIRSTFLTSDGSPAWSETLFRVESLFNPPGLTIGPDFFEVWAEAGCTMYHLTSGASGEDACAAAYELVEGREPIIVASAAPLQFRLTDNWVIDEARVVAVDAALAPSGAFAPEYSVSLQENVGGTLSVPIELDPGSWIVRIALNGNRQGDAFSAHYDVALVIGQ